MACAPSRNSPARSYYPRICQIRRVAEQSFCAETTGLARLVCHLLLLCLIRLLSNLLKQLHSCFSDMLICTSCLYIPSRSDNVRTLVMQLAASATVNLGVGAELLTHHPVDFSQRPTTPLGLTPPHFSRLCTPFVTIVYLAL